MRFVLLAVSAILLAMGQADAQPYPNRPIKFVVPFAAGGGLDLIARVLASRLETQMGQSVYVDNKPGAGSMVGTSAVTSAEPNGYTLLVVDPSVTTIPFLQPDASYQMKQLKAIATVASSPLMVVVRQDLPVNNLRELVAYSKSRPDGLTFGSAGIGTTLHLGPELFKFQSGFKATHVPYKGGGPALIDLMAGRVDVMFSTASNVLPAIKSGKIRAIAQTGTRRTAVQPDVPTAIESGFPDLLVEFWIGIFAPAGISPEIQNRLQTELKKAMDSPDFSAALEKAGLEANYRDSKAAEQFVQSESDRWGALIKAAKITTE